MKVFDWSEISSAEKNDELRLFFENGSALSIGCFDGPHKGHRVLFEEVLKKKAFGFVPGLVSFRRPLPVKFASSYLGDISTLSQRLSYYEEAGFVFVVLIDFSDEFSRIKGTDFLTVLKDSCNMKFLVEGPDFHCGYKGACKMEQIKDFAADNNISVSFPKLVLDGEERISSSVIRQRVKSGDFQTVFEMLGRPFCLDLNGVQCKKSGNTYRFSRASINQVLPQNGMYDVFVNTSRRLRARLEAGSEEILVEPDFNESSLIRIVEFINKE